MLRNPILMNGVINAQEFSQLQLALDQRSRQRTVKTSGRDALLLDILFHNCGGKIYRWVRQPRRETEEPKPYARCRNEIKHGEVKTPCQMKMIPYAMLEKAVTDDLLRHHGDWLIETRVTDTTRRVRVNEIDGEFMSLSAEFTAGRIDRNELRKRQDDLLDEKESLLSGHTSEAPEWQPTGETVAEHWARLSNADRRLWLLRIGAIWIVKITGSSPSPNGGHPVALFDVLRFERGEDQADLRERIVRPASAA